MNGVDLWALLLDAALVNNFVLAYFLGICPVVGVSGRLDSAGRMGLAVSFVMLVASLCAFGIHRLLVAIDAEYLALIGYIVVIASAVQLVEMFVRKTSPGLFKALGIYLPLITTNCAILAVALFQTQRGYGLLEGLVFALGAGLGFTLALVLMAGMDLPVRAIREQIASAVDLIVQQNRLKDGSRKITHLTEVQGMEGEIITLQDIFIFQQKGTDEKGKIIGQLRATGIRPKFMDRLEAAGIELPAEIFSPF